MDAQLVIEREQNLSLMARVKNRSALLPGHLQVMLAQVVTSRMAEAGIMVIDLRDAESLPLQNSAAVIISHYKFKKPMTVKAAQTSLGLRDHWHVTPARLPGDYEQTTQAYHRPSSRLKFVQRFSHLQKVISLL